MLLISSYPTENLMIESPESSCHTNCSCCPGYCAEYQCAHLTPGRLHYYPCVVNGRSDWLRVTQPVWVAPGLGTEDSASLLGGFVLQPRTTQTADGRRNRIGSKHEKHTGVLCPKKVSAHFLRISSVEKGSSARRRCQFCSRGQLETDTFSRLSSQTTVREKLLNLKMSALEASMLSFQKRSKVAGEDECVTSAHT